MIELERQPQLTAGEFTRLLKYKGNPDGSHDNVPLESKPLAAQIEYFDTHWREEGLPVDWYTLSGKVGFSMRNQMNLLKNPQDSEGVSYWAKLTRQNLLAFKLEYLSDHLVYPCEYQRDPINPVRFKSPLEKVDITDVPREEERKGSVRRAVQEAKEFFLQNESGVVVITSPRGPTGLKMDDGREIVYPDSYFFILQKEGDRIVNFTLKTDFTLAQCRDTIYKLTGKRLDVGSAVEDYVRVIAKIKPLGEVRSAKDVVSILEGIKPTYAFEKIEWREVYKDLREWVSLYQFDQKTHKVIEDFGEFCNQGGHTRLELQKATAVSVLLISKIFFERKRDEEIGSKPQEFLRPRAVYPKSYGDVLNAVSARSGCAGGNPVVVNSLTQRLGIPETGVLGKGECDCPDKTDNHYHCIACGKKYADETHKTERTKKCSCGFEFACN